MAEWSASPLVRAGLAAMEADVDRFVAKAPTRLDLMGGSAWQAGALTLSVPLEPAAYVVCQRRNDGKVAVSLLNSTGPNGAAPVLVDAALLAAQSELEQHLAGHDDFVLTALETLRALLSVSVLKDLRSGVSVAVGSAHEGPGDVAALASACAATAAAVASAYDVALDIDAAIEIARAVGVPSGRCAIGEADVVSALCGRNGHVTQVRGDPCAPAGSVVLGTGATVLGIDVGVVSERLDDKRRQTRVATAMGRELIGRIIAHDSSENATWGGYLARISVSDFVERFRDRIPTKITGEVFTSRFGEPAGVCGEVDPSFVYKVRSRTEHHVYEHDRAMQFVQYLTRAARVSDGGQSLTAAGELMYASHWSYGQRCGLGSIETDLMVNLLRQHGQEAGIFGAKITGQGCGGVVGVLMRDSEEAMTAVQRAMEAYQTSKKRTPRLLRSAGAGIMETGVVRM